MFARLSARRAIAASAVVLFHLILIFALIRITSISLGPPVLREIPIEIFFPRPKLPEKKKQAIPPPARGTHPIYIPLLTPPPPPPETNYNGLRALGRYLYNCSGAYYEQLSSREWAHCLADEWDLPAAMREKPPVLPPAKPSQFDIVVKERKEPAVPIEHQCKLGEMNSNLGLPCYDFSGQ